MKKIFNILMATAIATCTFTACEDVPEPYNNPYAGKTIGEEEVIDPAGNGTIDSPYNVAAAQALINSLGTDESDVIYVKGVINDLGNGVSAQYWNAQFYIADNMNGANKLLVYRTNYLGNVPFTSTDQIKEGDEVIMCGKVVNYAGNTHEFTTGTYIYSLNGKTAEEKPDTPVTEVGSIDNPQTIAQAIAAIDKLDDNATTDEFYFVKGKITKINTTGENVAKYKNINYVISDGGQSLTVYQGRNLDNTDFTEDGQINVDDEVIVYGQLQKYVKDGNVTPEIAKGNYIVKLTKGGTETPDTPSTDVKTVTIAEFNAAEVSDDVWYQLTGTVKNLKDGDLYGNFDLEDATGSVYVYGLLSEKGGEKKLFQELVAAKGIKEGSTITIIGTRGVYKDKIEVMNAYFVSIEEGGGDTPSNATSLTVDFKANGQGDWTIVDAVALSEGISYVWNYDSKYGMKASAYVSGTRYETDSWLISPALTLASEATLTFSQAQRYGSGSDLHVMVSTTYTGGTIDASQWSEVTIDQWPDGSNWNFITSTGKIAKGDNVHVAFRYTSSTTAAATWEIESASIK